MLDDEAEVQATDLARENHTGSPLDELGWEDWLAKIAPSWVQSGFGEHHELFWDWVWAVEANQRPDPLVEIMSRGHGKSTGAELACCAWASRRIRKYVVYASGTQDLADKHVDSIRALFGSRAMAEHYPEHGRPRLDKYGNSRGWRRNRLTTDGGFVVDALGLDVAARGVKFDDQRPDVIILDDVDNHTDTERTIQRKIMGITQGLIPAGSTDVAVLFVQNLVHEDSIAARLVDGRADFLANREVIGPVPAVEGLEVEWDSEHEKFMITEGVATWEGMDLEVCQSIIDDAGLTAFMAEYQHDTTPPAGGMYDHLVWSRCRWDEVPNLERIAVWVDPAVTDTDRSDSHAIQADGIAANGTVYRLWSWESRTTPLDSIIRAILKALELGAKTVGVETDQGGDTWESVFREALRDPRVMPTVNRLGWSPTFAQAKAGSIGSKRERSQKMLSQGYERGQVIHVEGTHKVLEQALRRFPETKPFDLADAAFWSWFDLVDFTPPAVSKVGFSSTARGETPKFIRP